MKFNRSGAAVILLAAAALVLSSCSSGGNTSSTASNAAKVDCGGKKSLTAGGSTAQANAMTGFISVDEKVCPGQTLKYTANGSGAGITEFLGTRPMIRVLVSLAVARAGEIALVRADFFRSK